LTAGAKLFVGMIAKPAFLTATAWNKPAAKRAFTGISSMTEVYIFKSIKENHSINLEKIRCDRAI
jgi:hypothetical protein